MADSLPAGRCPDPEAVAAFVCGELSPSSRGALVSHVDGCSSCRELVSGLVHLEHPADRQLRSRSPVSPASACAGDIQLAKGSTVGRYVVLDRLGEGGMGVVYAARDPELDRKVALKLLRGDFSQIAQGSLHRRLLQEAQAMARMAHPNVVTVYDVGTWRDRIFIAMEMVEGETLQEWLSGGPRFWREIVAMFLPAGHGLAAAHAAGLIHRDFKPANVFIGSDGRVRVGDFGLAATGTTGPRATDVDHGELAATADSQSAVGSMAGTPYYMAPEELLGDPTDARSDQFSFCVALYAAITGVHPFAGDNIEEIVGAMLDGRPSTPSRPRSMPRGLHRLLLRGLSVAPADRHPSMTALLESLARVGARKRHRVALSWAAGCALILAGTVGLGSIERAGGPPDDGAGRAHMGPRYDGAVFAGAVDVLEAYDREWVATHTDACESPAARCAIRATNLLRDAGFDRASRAWRSSGPEAELTWVDDHLNLTTTKSDGSIAQDVPWIIPPGRSQVFSVWIRGAHARRSARGRLTLRATGRGSAASSTTPFVARADWSQVSVTFSPKAHYSRFRAELALDSPGSVDVDRAELTGAGLVDASFENANVAHRSVAWRPYNDHTAVQTRWLVTDAVDGVRAVEVRTSRRGGSIAQDTTQRPLVGTTYTFAAWLRAGAGESAVAGNLALWATGMRDDGKLVKTGFQVGRDWTRVETSLDIDEYGYTALRAEIYVHTVDAALEIDATRLLPAGLLDASFEVGSPAWDSPNASTAVRAERLADPAFPMAPGKRSSVSKDGWHWLRVRAERDGGAIGQDVPHPLRGSTYTFSAWVRAAPGSGAPVPGSLIIRALDGAAEEARTPFRVSSQWTLVSTTLSVRHDHASLRVEVSLADAGAPIDIDGTRLTGANPTVPSSGTGR